MDIEDIVNQALIRLNQEQELRRLAILELFYRNIDVLINNSEKWFGNAVPEEYQKVLRSFMAISTSFLSEENDYRDMIFDDPAEKIYVVELLAVILSDLKKLFDKDIFYFEYEDENLIVLSSESKLKRSISSIFLSFMVFMDKNSKCRVSVTTDISSVTINLSFSNFVNSFPGIDMIQRAFFYYVNADEYRIGMGIDFALYRLRNIGAVVKIKKTGFDSSGILITITFLSEKFQEVVEDIRKSNAEKTIVHNRGAVLMMAADLIIGMVVAELLHNNGYTVMKVDFASVSESSTEQSKVLIVEFSYIIDNSIDPGSFRRVAGLFIRVLLIYSTEDENEITEYTGENILALQKPLDLEKLIEEVEKGYI